jgi:hypothetical protein
MVCEERKWNYDELWSDCSQIICESMSAGLHNGNVANIRVQKLWRTISAFSACVRCVFYGPYIQLQCGHGLCESCVWHCANRASLGSLCRMDECPVCGIATTTAVRLRPPTAGYRALSLDGGGIRGIVELKTLDHVLKPLKLGLEAHQFFDFIVGTSTGLYLQQVAHPPH